MKLKDTAKDDSLNRKEVASKYVSLIDTLEGNYVIALDAPWGSGKSTLIDLMEKDLKEKGIAYINYNAWDNDYLEDPFLSLVEEFNKQFIEKKYLPIQTKTKALKEIAYEASKRVVPSILKGATQFFIGSDAVEKLGDGTKEIAKALIESSTDNVSEVFEKIDESKKAREKFKKKLAEIIQEMIDSPRRYKKLLFIVDELDRCKPTFAIELLEHIKHLFEIDNIIFLISVDKTQLSESIKAVYGNGFDSISYLKRFFNFELHLQFDKSSNFIENKYILFFNDDGDMSLIGGKELVVDIFNILELSLRDYEQILVELFLLENISEIFDRRLFFILLCLKYNKNEIFDYIKKNKESEYANIRNNIEKNFGSKYGVIVQELGKPKLKNEYSKNYYSDKVFNAIKLIESSLD